MVFVDVHDTVALMRMLDQKVGALPSFPCIGEASRHSVSWMTAVEGCGVLAAGLVVVQYIICYIYMYIHTEKLCIKIIYIDIEREI